MQKDAHCGASDKLKIESNLKMFGIAQQNVQNGVKSVDAFLVWVTEEHQTTIVQNR